MSSLQTPVQSTMTTDGTSWKNLNKEIPYFFASLLAMFWSLSPSARRPGPRSRIFSSTIIHCYKSSRSRPSSPPHLAFSHRLLLTQAATNLPRRSRVTQLPDTYLHPSHLGQYFQYLAVALASAIGQCRGGSQWPSPAQILQLKCSATQADPVLAPGGQGKGS